MSAPQDVAVVGAGMVGLATAWFLNERGVNVTVYERDQVAAGSSWGNAGWLTPGIATPLPEPAVLRYGIRALLSPSSPVYVPPAADLRLARFLAGFARHSTARHWSRAMHALIPLNARSLGAFDELAEGGVEAVTRAADQFLAAYRTSEERTVLLEELELIHRAGQDIAFDLVTGDEARGIAPLLSGEIGAAIRLRGQRFINPGEFVNALADAVRKRGVELHESANVTGIRPEGDGVVVVTDGRPTHHDRVVLATGAWLGELGRQFGIRLVVQAGRGYSFSVPVDDVPEGPVYFPQERVACTPLGDRLRIAGMMEFRAPEAPLDQRRIRAIVDAARPLLSGVDLDDRQDEWVGSRPVTRDGLPLVGRTDAPGVYAAGGHGMWGITLGPITGKLLADAIVDGRDPSELAPLRPTR
ncbi:NAD(P)/FAD-dependent oxidoreductase [Nocardioides alcanivorans]|uniref:NAD(P)/FAD-dependent oxidoreductase n=1 Tax=Nocardioides alcanivorans TaxID=2897352 RepID=UPI001F433D94|nr:FAD-dependent oxidoreductase [Nocardioides alcanivorans]